MTSQCRYCKVAIFLEIFLDLNDCFILLLLLLLCACLFFFFFVFYLPALVSVVRVA